ncbi:tetratricopeptide repeat protein [Ferdinandcohnia quinoae]|uniref:Tetratricopeptide repeat protein n=1 Tax=Fredinandcohnia quinoae TaxID=2918902 RepID=A0AAW5E9F5_9BACI|nr:tetratricopeptide repeat protein [Fredinandcohnia sp. SECRCQ15]MCH1627619.1 tetratricopeptide repeat protein [Fredinandcohnia sp. SECRCQ15]
MTKENNKDKKIIQFPNLKERLLEKGLDALTVKRFNDALAFLRQAQELEKDHPEIELGIVICLFELGQFNKAKENCWQMLKKDLGDYFHVLQIYLMILIQLGEYKEVETTIEAVIEENSIPEEYYDNLLNLLELSKKMISPKSKIEIESKPKLDLHEQLQQVLLNENDVHNQLQLVQSLKELNIRTYLAVFKEFLENEEKHPIVKTIIVQLLNDNGVNEEIVVKKNGSSVTVIPADLLDTSANPFAQKVLLILENKLMNDNPTLFETARDIWLRHLFVLFPLTLENENSHMYAAALHLYSAELHGFEIANHELENEYHVSLFHLKYTLERLREVEAISVLD